MGRLSKSWWLLAVCGVLDAIISIIYLIGQDTAGLRAWRFTVIFLGQLTLAAGICTIAAALWSSRNRKSWLLVLSGAACTGLGAILAFWTGPLTFRLVALLIAVMALSTGIYELTNAPSLRHLPNEWLVKAAGVVSIGFAVAFLAFVFRWIKLEPSSPAQSLHWLGCYFAFSAISILILNLRQPSLLTFDRGTRS